MRSLCFDCRRRSFEVVPASGAVSSTDWTSVSEAGVIEARAQEQSLSSYTTGLWLRSSMPGGCANCDEGRGRDGCLEIWWHWQGSHRRRAGSSPALLPPPHLLPSPLLYFFPEHSYPKQGVPSPKSVSFSNYLAGTGPSSLICEI